MQITLLVVVAAAARKQNDVTGINYRTLLTLKLFALISIIHNLFVSRFVGRQKSLSHSLTLLRLSHSLNRV